MIQGFGRILLLIINWLELAFFSVFMYAAALLPEGWRGWYLGWFRLWCRAFVRALGVDLRLHQKNAKPLPAQFILIANHPSAFEDIGVPALFNVYSLAKIEVKGWFIVGRISQAAGTLYLKREDRLSRKEAAEQILATLAQGKNVCVYPEGGCKGRRVNPFNRGIFDLSLQSKVPILPVFLHYEAQEDFEWQPSQTLMDKIWHVMTASNKRVNYYVFDAIDPADFSDKNAYCDYVHGLYLQWQAKYLE